jgi:hypothetical protein
MDRSPYLLRDAVLRLPKGAITAMLWLLFALMVIAWALILWHPWIDWFGRPR